MKLPVDTSAIAFLCTVEAEPVVDFETKRPRADENGEPLYLVQLIAMTDGAAEILAVKVAGMPSGLRQGHPVKVHGLVAQPCHLFLQTFRRLGMRDIIYDDGGTLFSQLQHDGHADTAVAAGNNSDLTF